ncbi:MAG: hypothetical protein IT459_22695 [Planctomycetes bacterium]|nr:hypothetical protein [Planctomycetota bacterium]
MRRAAPRAALGRLLSWINRRRELEDQLEHARRLISHDARWLASDDPSAALCARYLAAVGTYWRSMDFEHGAELRARLGLDPRGGPNGFNVRNADERRRLRALLDEVRHCLTRDDELPGDLLPRIDAALDGRPE